jgi:trypsin-like peptidase
MAAHFRPSEGSVPSFLALIAPAGWRPESERPPDDNNFGTGFLVADNLVVTCCHVVQQIIGICGDRQNSRILESEIGKPLVGLRVWMNGRVFEADLAHCINDYMDDLALLRLNGRQHLGVVPPSLCPEMPTCDLKGGVAYGVQFGRNSIAFPRRYLDLPVSGLRFQPPGEKTKRFAIDHYLGAQDGMSGGPVMDPHSQMPCVLAMLVSGGDHMPSGGVLGAVNILNALLEIGVDDAQLSWPDTRPDGFSQQKLNAQLNEITGIEGRFISLDADGAGYLSAAPINGNLKAQLLDAAPVPGGGIMPAHFGSAKHVEEVIGKLEAATQSECRLMTSVEYNAHTSEASRVGRMSSFPVYLDDYLGADEDAQQIVTQERAADWVMGNEGPILVMRSDGIDKVTTLTTEEAQMRQIRCVLRPVFEL